MHISRNAYITWIARYLKTSKSFQSMTKYGEEQEKEDERVLFMAGTGDKAWEIVVF